MLDMPPDGYTLDAGAFLALERRSSLMLGILEDAFNGRAEIAIPRTVIAQIWRGTPRQANVARLINTGLPRQATVIIDELTDARARQIGFTIGRISRADIADVHVALVAAERGHAVVTSDEGDINKVDSTLVIVRV